MSKYERKINENRKKNPQRQKKDKINANMRSQKDVN